MVDYLHKLAMRCLPSAHCFYFGAVAVEGHGLYASVAAFLLVLSLVEIVGDWLS